ncbi:Ig-like domain (group 2), partial [Desulforamulus putei DSM 12395]
MNLNDKKTKKVVAGIVAGAMGMNIVPAMMPVVDSDLAGMFGVRAAEAAVPTELARNVAFTDTDTNGGQIAGNVTWEAAANESNITDYVVYYLNASDQKVGEAIGTVAKGGTYSVTINVDTAIPTGATQIGVFSKNTEGESATAAKVAIVDDKSGDANNAPTVTNPINDITGTAGGEAVTIDASGTFEDQDGDSLTLTAASSDESIATVTVNGTDIVVTPVAEGTATITVTADDGNGGKVNTTFDIVVSAAPAPANNAPTVANPINDITGTAGG